MKSWRERAEDWADAVRLAAAGRGYTCDGCGKEVFSYPEERLCADCLQALERNAGRRCLKCGRRTIAKGLCLECKSRPPRFERGFSPFVYEGFAAGLLNRFKNGERYLAFFFGEAMAACFVQALSEGIADCSAEELLVISVPSSERRRKERGYDQAAELAKSVARSLNAVRAPGTLTVNRETFSQKRLTAEERRRNVEGAYAAKKDCCKGRAVLLTDDLMTTGATADACAVALLKAGAEKVYFLSAASVPEKPLTEQK